MLMLLVDSLSGIIIDDLYTYIHNIQYIYIYIYIHIYIQKDPLHFPNIRNKSSTELKGTKSKKKKFVNSAAF